MVVLHAIGFADLETVPIRNGSAPNRGRWEQSELCIVSTRCVITLIVLVSAVMNEDRHSVSWGRRNDRGLLVLVSLADSPKHGYALLKDIEQFAGVSLSPGTLYSAIARLEDAGLVEAMGAAERRRPYRLTMTGRAALSAELESAAALSRMGLRRLRAATA